MRRLLPVVLAAALPLSGCITTALASGKLQAADIPPILDAFAAAGCSGNVSVSVGGGTGQLGGGVQASYTLSGSCDPSRVVPLKELGDEPVTE